MAAQSASPLGQAPAQHPDPCPAGLSLLEAPPNPVYHPGTLLPSLVFPPNQGRVSFIAMAGLWQRGGEVSFLSIVPTCTYPEKLL